MCGIAGVRKFGETPITGEELIMLLCHLEHRGPHATGIALSNGREVVVHKAPQPAWQYTKSKEFVGFLEANLTEDTQIALLHTRAATKGNPQINVNNHPMFDGETAIVHNGMINNETFLFGQGKYKRSCETDSDIVRAIVHEYGINQKGVRELNKMSGSAAIACVDQREPGKLLLARSGSPLVYGFTPDGDKLYWASEGHAIMRATRPFYEVRGVWVQDTASGVSIASMPDNTAWVFDDAQRTFHQEFKTCFSYKTPDYSKLRETYSGKARGWKKALKAEQKAQLRAEQEKKNIIPAIGRTFGDLKDAVIQCECGTGVINTKGRPWESLVCPKCNKALG
jgi:glucosamine 6-phosphate synthetase-like amidotransferase/phosphosugar isomerase protein